ncbi:MAG: hypothetical protein IKO75_09430 [Bacteroidales bacterium]|nr:hypothetical protein [Bacteroidales bacterium]
MEDKIKTTVEKIVKLAKADDSFAKELRKYLDEMFPDNTSVADSAIKKDIKTIRETLEIRSDVSISYDFIQNRRLRDQLIIDNLRMENVLMDTRMKSTDRFVDFCINAFYQIENIINYYFIKTYPQRSVLLDALEKATAEDGEFAFRRSDSKGEMYIPFVFKVNSFYHLLLPNDKFHFTVTSLRKLRNLKLHRASFNEAFDESDFSSFFQYQNFDSIREGLKRIVNAVKEQDGYYYCEAAVKSLLPGACMVSFDGHGIDITGNSYQKLKKVGITSSSKVLLHMHYKEVVDFTLI